MMGQEKAMVPEPEECIRLLKRFQVPEKVIEHSQVVHRLALYLCQMLNQYGEELDAAQVEAGSLLHDIAKVRSQGRGENHSQAGARLLVQLGYGEVADIVRQHVVLDSGIDHGRITEEVVVHYADKRVLHTKVVSLRDRFQDLQERYGKSPEARAFLEDLERQSRLVEDRIFQKIPISPEDLIALR
jgi:putative nucleotidyltransferase with HDIG domain